MGVFDSFAPDTKDKTFTDFAVDNTAPGPVELPKTAVQEAFADIPDDLNILNEDSSLDRSIGYGAQDFAGGGDPRDANPVSTFEGLKQSVEAVPAMVDKFKAEFNVLEQEFFRPPTNSRFEREYNSAKLRAQLSGNEPPDKIDFITKASDTAAIQYEKALNDVITADKAMQTLRPQNDPTAAFAFDVGSTIAQQIPAMLTGGTMRVVKATAALPAALSVMGGQVFTDTVAQLAINHPELSRNELTGHAAVKTTIEIFTEAYPWRVLTKGVSRSALNKFLTFEAAEIGQEMSTEVLDGIWDMATLNPKLTWREIINRTGYTGLITMFAAPGISTPFILQDRMVRAQQKKKVDDFYLETTGQTQEEFYKSHQGPPVPKGLRELLDMKKMLEAELTKKGELEGERLVLPDGSKAPSSFALIMPAPLVSQEKAARADATLPVLTEQGEIVKLGEVDWSQSNNVVLTANDFYALKLQDLKAQEKLHLNVLKTADPAHPDYLYIIQNSEQALTRIQKQRNYAENIIISEQAALKKGKAFLENVISKIYPDLEIILNTTKYGELGFERNLTQLSGVRGNVQIFEGNRAIISMNMEHLTDKFGVLNDTVALSTLKHEFGHAVMIKLFKKQTPEIQNALLNSWEEDLNKITKPDENGRYVVYEEYVKRRIGLIAAKDSLEGMSAEILGTPLQNLNGMDIPYGFGLAEWVANNMQKMRGNKNINAATEKYFKEAGAELKEIWKTAKDEYGATETFEKFIELLQANVNLANFHPTDTNTANLTTPEQADLVKARLDRIAGKVLPQDEANNLNSDMDKFGKMAKFAYTLLQVAQKNSHIIGVRDYVKGIRDWHTLKMAWTSRADDVVKLWLKLNNKRMKSFNRFLFDLTLLSDKKGQRFAPNDVEFLELVEQHEVTPEELALYDMIDQSFQGVLSELEDVLVKEATETNKENPDQLELELKRIYKELGELKNSNFFPLSRFGKYYVKVVAKRPTTIEGVNYKLGDIISFETFETKKQMKKRLAQAKKNKHQVEGDKLSDMQKEFAGFPPSFLRLLENRLQFSPEQQAEFSAILKDISPAQSFKQHLRNRKNVAGFDMDAMRGWSNYFMHFSNHIARIKYRGPLEAAVRKVADSADVIRAREGEALTRTEIKEFLKDHMDYVMNPGDEWAMLRSVGFIYLIGFVPLSAIVNLTQVPLVTYPYLAARYGDAKAVAAISKAYKTTTDYWRHPQRVSQGLHIMLDKLKANGSIDESMATELAGVSEGSVIQRVLPGTVFRSEIAAREIRRVAGWSAYLFQAAEKLNRRVTAIAAYELENERLKATGVAPNDRLAPSIKAAQNAVDGSQYEFARWNRPRFMRGEKSVLFLFYTFRQNTLFFVGNDPGASRYLLMMLLVAGLSGLPGSDDIMDIVDFLLRQMNKATGNYRTVPDVRFQLRQLMNEINVNPDLMMHGVSRYSFGLPSLADKVGIPFPNIDMSGRLALSRVVPGVQPIFGRESSFSDTFSKSSEDFGGAVASIPLQWLRAISDTDNPNTLKRFERAFPSSAKMFSRTYRFASEGAQVPDGAMLEEFDLGNSTHWAELLATAIGGAPTRVNQAKEKYWMTKEIVQYYELRRRSFLRLLDYAYERDDDKMQDKVLQEIDKWNQTIPFIGFSISGQDIKRSLTTRKKKRMMEESGITVPKKQIEMQDYADSAFPEAPTDGTSEDSNPFEGFSVEKVK